MYFIVSNIVLIMRVAFFGGMICSLLTSILYANAILIGMVIGCVCLVLIGVTKIFLICAKDEMAHWIPRRWDDLSNSDFEKIPVGLKIIFLLQHGSIVLTVAVFGWFVLLMVVNLL